MSSTVRLTLPTPVLAHTLSTVLAISLFFLICSCGSGEALPLFGSLLGALGSGSGTAENGTSILQILLLEHLQDKLDNLAELASIFIG